MPTIAEHFHGDLFAELRGIGPTGSIPDDIPPLPATPLGAYDSDVQRQFTYAAGIPLFRSIYELLEGWCKAYGPVESLRKKQEGVFMPLAAPVRELLALFGTPTLAGARAQSLFPEVLTDTYLAATAELRSLGHCRHETDVLDDPRLSLLRQGTGVYKTETYVERNASIGLIICSSLLAMSHAFAEPREPWEALSIAANSETLLILTAPLGPVIASSLLMKTGSKATQQNLRGFYRIDLFERFDIPGLGPAIRLKRAFLEELLQLVRRPIHEWVGGAKPGDEPPQRFACLALKVIRGELNLIQFTFRWMIEAMRQLKRF